jgi:tRNA(fMet)-specific endonuclease VapC
LVCSVTHGELWALAYANGFGEPKREAIRTMLDSLVTIDIGAEAVVDAYVKIYTVLRGHPKGARTNIGENDMWIAATARATGATLLTTDQHFVPLFTGTVQGVLIPTTSRLP